MYLRKLLKGLWHSVETWPIGAFRQRERENRKRGGRETRGAAEAWVEFALKGVRFNSPTGHPVTPNPPPLLSISYPPLRKEKRSSGKLKTYNKNGFRETEIESLTLRGLIRVNRLRRADCVHTGSQLHSLSPAATHQHCQLTYQLSPKPCRAVASLAGCCGLICHFISWWISWFQLAWSTRILGKYARKNEWNGWVKSREAWETLLRSEDL